MRAFWALGLAGLALIAFPPFTVAYIPAKPLPEKGWDGPGQLCEKRFTLTVNSDEYVREDIQLEPWYPVSNTIKSPTGWFGITQASDRPSRNKLGKLLQSRPQGMVYDYGVDDLTGNKLLIFLPRNRTHGSVVISFYPAYRSSTNNSDWRAAPQVGYDPAEYDSVLRRIVFNNAARTDCLNRGAAK